MRTGDLVECAGRRWRADRAIGAGHTAEVWLLVADDGPSAERLVAKCIRPPRPGSVGRGLSPTDFVAETGTLHRLLAAEGDVPRDRSRFPWVYACDAGKRFFVMEFVRGVPLQDVIGVRLLTIEQVLAIAIQLTEALAATVRAGLRNTDLKLDAVLWDAEAERLVILDWNVCRERRPTDDAGWLSPELGFIAAVLDGVLLHASQGVADALPDWSQPFTRAPERWGSYLRVFQRVLTELAESPDARSLDALHARLVAIAEALARQPEALLSAVKQQVAGARPSPRAQRQALTEAVAFAELAVAARRHAVALRARLLMGEALELLGPTADSLEILRATATGAGQESLVAPGEGVVLHRLRRFARVRTAALGIGGPLTEALTAFEDQRWRKAADRLGALLERFAQSAELAGDLRALFDEASGLGSCLEGLRALDEADRLGLEPPGGDTTSYALAELERRRVLVAQAVADLERGLAQLDAVPWAAALMGMLSHLPQLLDRARSELGQAPGGVDGGRSSARAPADRAPRPRAPAPPATVADRSEASALVAGPVDQPAARPGPMSGRSPERMGAGQVSHGQQGGARLEIRQPRQLPRELANADSSANRSTLIDFPSPVPAGEPSGAAADFDLDVDFDLDAVTEISAPPERERPRPRPGGIEGASVESDRVPSLPPAAPPLLAFGPEPVDESEAGPAPERALWWVLAGAVALAALGVWWVVRPDDSAPLPPSVVAPASAVAVTPAQPDAAGALDIGPQVDLGVMDSGSGGTEADAVPDGPPAQTAARAAPPRRRSRSRSSREHAGARSRELLPAPPSRGVHPVIQAEDQPEAPREPQQATRDKSPAKPVPKEHLPGHLTPEQTGYQPPPAPPAAQIDEEPSGGATPGGGRGPNTVGPGSGTGQPARQTDTRAAKPETVAPLPSRKRGRSKAPVVPSKTDPSVDVKF